MDGSDYISVMYPYMLCSDGVVRTVWYDTRGAVAYIVIEFKRRVGHFDTHYPVPPYMFILDPEEGVDAC